MVSLCAEGPFGRVGLPLDGRLLSAKEIRHEVARIGTAAHGDPLVTQPRGGFLRPTGAPDAAVASELKTEVPA
jgi:hypothetical protein